MKVTGVKTYVVENEPGERSGGGDPTIRWYVGGKFFLILELTTDEGIIGIGEKFHEKTPMLKVFSSTKDAFNKFKDEITNCFVFSDTEIKRPPVIYRIIK